MYKYYIIVYVLWMYDNNVCRAYVEPVTYWFMNQFVNKSLSQSVYQSIYFKTYNMKNK